MPRHPDHTAPDGLNTGIPEPSTRRVPSGSPDPAPPGANGEPNFSGDAADDIFATLKERINRLWDAPDDVEAARVLLTGLSDD